MPLTPELKWAVLVTKDDPARGVRLAYELLQRETSHRAMPERLAPILRQAQEVGAEVASGRSDVDERTALTYVDLVFFLVERAMQSAGAETVAV
jgi:hypothetical protein